LARHAAEPALTNGPRAAAPTVASSFRSYRVDGASNGRGDRL